MGSSTSWSYTRARVLEDLVASVAAGRNRRVIGAGGAGKTWLLDALEQRLTDTSTMRFDAALGQQPPTEPIEVLLVDDADLAEPDMLDAVLATGATLILAHRPVSAEVGPLLDRIDRSPVVLGPLNDDEIRCLLEARWGQRPPAATVTAIAENTGRLARWIELTALVGPEGTTAVPALDEAIRAECRTMGDAAERLLRCVGVLEGMPRTTLARAAGLDSTELDAAIDALLRAGLAVDDHPCLAPMVAEEVRRGVSDVALLDMADNLLASGSEDIAEVAYRLVAAGARGDAVGRCFVVAALQHAEDDPARAHSLLSAARNAGVDRGVAAEASMTVAYLQGRTDDVLALADEALRAPDPGLVSGARRAAVAVLAARGSWGAARRLIGSTGNEPDLGALIGLATGDRAQVDELASAVGQQVDGLQGGWLQALVSGIAMSMRDSALPALGELLEAARLEEVTALPIRSPEPTSALAALVATLAGEFDLAVEVIRSPIGTAPPGVHHRRGVTASWVSLRRGDWTDAKRTLDAVRVTSEWDETDTRLVLAADAVEAGIARRSGDFDALIQVWRDARTRLLRIPPDLLLLPVLGELCIAGSRLGDHGTVASVTLRINAALDNAGNPALWELPVRWDQLHAAIARDDRAEAHRLAERINATTAAGPRVEALIAAATPWVSAIDGQFDPDTIRQAATGLADASYLWEASRLAGAAAIRTHDREVMRVLLELARSFPAAGAPSGGDARSALSARELEVATHVAAGLTYRQIGAQLFISPKTVEHHVAHIRRKLGAGSREELLLMIRQQLPEVDRGSRDRAG